MRADHSLTIEVQEYLRDRRHLGFSLAREGSQLLAFARFAEIHGYDGHLTEELAKAWGAVWAAAALFPRSRKRKCFSAR